MEKITVYEKPTCTTCRKTVKMLNEMGVEFDRINYYIEPFTKAKLKKPNVPRSGGANSNIEHEKVEANDTGGFELPDPFSLDISEEQKE